MSPPGSALIPSAYNDRYRAAFETGEAVVELVRRGITPKDIMSEAAIKTASRCYGHRRLDQRIHTCAWVTSWADPADVMHMFDEISNEIPTLQGSAPQASNTTVKISIRPAASQRSCASWVSILTLPS